MPDDNRQPRLFQDVLDELLEAIASDPDAAEQSQWARKLLAAYLAEDAPPNESRPRGQSPAGSLFPEDVGHRRVIHNRNDRGAAPLR